jgi:predicted outer membrane repeat protein
MTDGKIINNSCYTSGGGVYNSGTFVMSGGEITGNRATNSVVV